ncbi:hypothetical protein COT48_00290 [Candidatus Woesearchaeota archaeon CG08_land_8_20_14_0_20_47_9]|nr:MAG: hypothetical protein AUJ69_01510 [Candidatus Woesearchaeota archaeon CG1_02_47_18]PIN76627.1 MAG: hypothetical protein COV22_00135 [Candidatus Woesearchaeota archaeon CG10_big_fil_rev_8_21_14_0_10_47_5]PIO04458.1 MAG: hypothetical protein COT48_00290 [Candidatus Woesearchaeota archaeon CG08_land_8_20_14_0_20_47_9]
MQRKAKASAYQYIYILVFTIGLTSVCTQAVLLRELASLFRGAEVSYLIAISTWLVLGGAGSVMAKRMFRGVKPGFLYRLGIIVAVLPLLSLIGIRLLAGLFVSGQLLGPGAVVLLALASLAPYCLVMGAVFSVACSLAGRRHARFVYALDGLGFAVGGVLFAMAILMLDNTSVAIALMALNALILFVISIISFRKPLASGLPATASLLLLIAILLFMHSSRISLKTLQQAFPGQSVLGCTDSEYGRIIVTNTSGQLNFFYNSERIFSDPEAQASEWVHFGLAQLNPRRILLISCSPDSAYEALKHNTAVDYLQHDRMLLEAMAEFGVLPETGRVNIVRADAIDFIGRAQEYDAVISCISSPSSIQEARFYNLEFARMAKTHMSSEGVFMLSLPLSGEYVSSEASQLYSTVYSTLKQVFSNVIALPVAGVTLIASDRALRYDIADAMAERNMTAHYVNHYYLDKTLTPERISRLNSSINPAGPVSTAARPRAYYSYLQEWLLIFNGPGFIAPFGFIIAGIVLFFIVAGGGILNVFSSSMSASLIFLALLMLFQQYHGVLFSRLSIISGVFMLGLAVGSIVTTRASRNNKNSRPEARAAHELLSVKGAVDLACIALAMLLFIIITRGIHIGTLLIYMLSSLCGAIVGAAFSFSSHKSEPSRLYLADACGAAVAGIIMSLFVPLMGLEMAVIGMAIVKVISMFR